MGMMNKSVLLALLIGSFLTVCFVLPSEDSSGDPDPGYTVSFISNGGSGSMDDVTGISGVYQLPPCGFTAPAGMKYRCWSVGGEILYPGDDITVTEDTAVTALWTERYTVSFDGNEGTGSMQPAHTKGEFEVPECGFRPPQGKEFWCWTDPSHGHHYPGDTMTVTSDIWLTAQWTDVGTYTVVFDPNGGSGYMRDVIDMDGYYPLPNNGFDPPAQNISFVCWQLDGTNMNPGDWVHMTKNYVAIAIWTPYNTVTYDANGGTGEMAPDSYITEDSYTLRDNGFTAPEGKVFACWSIGDVYKNPGDSIEINSDLVVKAVWANIYTVAYDANGGTGEMSSDTYTFGDYRLKTNEFTAPSEKIFRCWSIGGVYKNPGDRIDVTSNLTVKAVWMDVYDVTYDANGGTGEMAPDIDIIGDYNLKFNGFTAPEGKAFKCWSVDNVLKTPGDRIDVTSDVIVKAVWKDSPAPEPEPSRDSESNYSNNISAGTDTIVTETFANAKAANGTVDIKAGDLDIRFDKDAVSTIGGNDVSLKAEMRTDGTGIEGAKAVIEITLDGVSFPNGKATVSVPFTDSVPKGQVLKVYFIDGAEKTEMTDATYQDGRVTFTTNHFSTYAIMYDGEAKESIIEEYLLWIVLFAVAEIVILGVAVFILMKRR